MASAPTPTPAASSGMTNNVAGLLCYLPLSGIGLIISIVFLCIEPYNKNRFVRFHAFQSIFLHVALLALGIAMFILSALLGMITRGFGFLFILLWPLIGIGSLVLFVVMMVKAYSNEETKLPVVGDLAAKQAGA